ncbi:MAG: hypothetical protein AAB766_01410 [Patescibacteria group bacterium]
MFEQLFGSGTRVKLMRVFLENPEGKFFVRELSRMTDSLINSVRRELKNLIELKLIKTNEVVEPLAGEQEKKGLNVKKYYYLNKKNLFLQDLTNLFAKGRLLLEKKLIERIKKLGEIKFISFGGIFVDDEKAVTDLLIIGDLELDKAKENLKKFEQEVGRTIRYTIMDENEYSLRKDIADGFLDKIMANGSNIVVLDKLTKKKRTL